MNSPLDDRRLQSLERGSLERPIQKTRCPNLARQNPHPMLPLELEDKLKGLPPDEEENKLPPYAAGAPLLPDDDDEVP